MENYTIFSHLQPSIIITDLTIYFQCFTSKKGIVNIFLFESTTVMYKHGTATIYVTNISFHLKFGLSCLLFVVLIDGNSYNLF